MTEAQRVRLASRYVRAVRGKGLQSGESPIKLAVKLLAEMRHASFIGVPEKNIDYLDKNKGVMLEVISANKHKLPKRTKRAKPEFLESFAWRIPASHQETDQGSLGTGHEVETSAVR
ncbi:MAG: hypothetical protein EBV32_03975 [Proteobacteria bacterium]|uniref:Uncharacterized protein n=1 Tax=Candidatus Fonsibacter lacus TaxID=2576439 RepID=A0A964XRQ9_9PROT|nr:hypothetical protein [Candidatus Fonsibacter lacus]